MYKFYVQVCMLFCNCFAEIKSSYKRYKTSYKTNNTHNFVRALVKLPTLGTFETVQTPSAIASGV